jgi:hypothetical protein
LTFEGLKDLEPINDFYNGGTGGFGSGPGTNYGIAFTPDSLALIARSAGGSGAFANNPSGVTIAFFQKPGSADTMNVAAGFTTGLSFFYSADVPGAVNVYDGLNGTGNLLATLPLPVTGNNGTPGVDEFNHWAPVAVPFAGTAESAVFTGNDGEIGFDDITLGSQTPGVPEPAGIILLGIGGLGMIGHRLLRRNVAA